MLVFSSFFPPQYAEIVQYHRSEKPFTTAAFVFAGPDKTWHRKAGWFQIAGWCSAGWRGVTCNSVCSCFYICIRRPRPFNFPVKWLSNASSAPSVKSSRPRFIPLNLIWVTCVNKMTKHHPSVLSCRLTAQRKSVTLMCVQTPPPQICCQCQCNCCFGSSLRERFN